MAGAPVWYELMVPDPGAVALFYRAVIGWEIAPEGRTMPNGADYRMIVRKDGGFAGGVLSLAPAMIEGGATPGWFPYFQVEDTDDAVEKAKSLGATVWMEPESVAMAGRIAMLSDPQGAPFYVMAPTPPLDMPDAQSDVFAQNETGHCWWQELDTNDAEQASAFYGALFDWSTDNTMPMGDGVEYRFIELEGKGIGAFNPLPREGKRLQWLLYFGVEDILRSCEAAEANGGYHSTGTA